ncbi:MAG: hypothetical protein ACP5K1_06230 [Candidatus Bathyarchaeia archaeon]
MELSDVVGLNFQGLRHACRFEKGGLCKKARIGCAIEKCPLIIK